MTLALAFGVVRVDKDGGEEEESREAHYVGVKLVPLMVAFLEANSFYYYGGIRG